MEPATTADTSHCAVGRQKEEQQQREKGKETERATAMGTRRGGAEGEGTTRAGDGAKNRGTVGWKQAAVAAGSSRACSYSRCCVAPAGEHDQGRPYEAPTLAAALPPSTDQQQQEPQPATDTQTDGDRDSGGTRWDGTARDGRSNRSLRE